MGPRKQLALSTIAQVASQSASHKTQYVGAGTKSHLINETIIADARKRSMPNTGVFKADISIVNHYPLREYNLAQLEAHKSILQAEIDNKDLAIAAYKLKYNIP